MSINSSYNHYLNVLASTSASSLSARISNLYRKSEVGRNLSDFSDSPKITLSYHKHEASLVVVTIKKRVFQ